MSKVIRFRERPDTIGTAILFGLSMIAVFLLLWGAVELAIYMQGAL